LIEFHGVYLRILWKRLARELREPAYLVLVLHVWSPLESWNPLPPAERTPLVGILTS
jgi:hypothetical protein